MKVRSFIEDEGKDGGQDGVSSFLLEFVIFIGTGLPSVHLNFDYVSQAIIKREARTARKKFQIFGWISDNEQWLYTCTQHPPPHPPPPFLSMKQILIPFNRRIVKLPIFRAINATLYATPSQLGVSRSLRPGERGVFHGRQRGLK